MRLDETDKEILQHLASGKTAKEIAPLVCKSSDTVKHRVKKMLRSLNCKNATHLIATLTKNNAI